VSAAPAISRAIDRGTAALAAVVLLVVVVTFPGAPPAEAWLALPLVLIASRAPLVLPAGSADSLVIGLDSSLMVLLGLTIPWQQALLVWGISISLAELTSNRVWDTRLFNAGVCVLAGAAALLVMRGAPDDPASTRSLVAALVAAVVYFGVDYVWSAVSIAAVNHSSLLRLVDLRGLPLALACFVGVDSLGFLTVVVLHHQPWAVGLLIVPFAALLWASRSWSNTSAEQRRGTQLSAASYAVQAATSPIAVEDVILEHVPLMMRAPGVAWSEPDTSPDGADLVAVFAPGGRPLHALVVDARTSGSPYDVRDEEALRMLLGVAEQAYDRLQLLAELGRAATTDSLTGTSNRQAFTEELAAVTARGERAAVLYCDLDGFKAVNDTHGHASGDAVLTEVARRIRTTVRPGDLVARLGGDEFAVLLRTMPDAGGDLLAQTIADRVCTALAAPYVVEGRRAVLSVSVGIALADGGDAEHLLVAGDAAMYAAKGAGGGRSRAYTVELIEERREHARLIEDLRVGVAGGQLRVHYQPIVAALDGGVVAVEALVRWQHPTRGLLAPGVFLGAAAEAGLMDDIGVQVLRTAVEEVSRAARAAGRSVQLSVNANATQLVSGSLHAAVQELLPLDGVRLVVEVTEDEVVDGAALEALRALRALGVRIALDDFGTGWSSLSLLRRLPVDTLKLDKSFVADLPEDARATELARAIIDMAGALGLGTVAEGVEHAAQSTALRLMGCAMLQGFHFGRPAPASSLSDLMQASRAPV
jgi:diguanylate cyclase (GGDEF)-like protein